MKEFYKFLDEIERTQCELKCTKSGAFFRGVSKSSYKLIPTLLRHKTKSDIEHNLYSNCYARAKHLMPLHKSSWEFLSLMQHYGIPTRLLDWTESLALAIFFAIQDTPDDPCIWVINGYRLNTESGARDRYHIIVPGIDQIGDYYEYFAFENKQRRKEWPYKKPIFIEIPRTFERIYAQKGYFTFHPNSEPLENISKFVRKVEIPKTAIDGAKRFLNYAGVDEYTAFPDLYGFAQYLRKRYIR